MVTNVLENRLHGTNEAQIESETFFSRARDSVSSIDSQRSPSLIVPEVIDQDYHPLSNIQRSPSLIIPDYLSTSSIEHNSSIVADENIDVKKELKFEETNDSNRIREDDENDIDFKYNNQGKYNFLLAEARNKRISYHFLI